MEIELMATARLSENEVAESEAHRHRALETAAQANARSAAASRSASRPTYGDYHRLRQYVDELQAERQDNDERQTKNEKQIGDGSASTRVAFHASAVFPVQLSRPQPSLLHGPRTCGSCCRWSGFSFGLLVVPG